MKLLTAAQMKQVDQRTIKERGIDEFALMQAAARAVAEDVATNFEQGHVVVLCGKGNNGGDGLLAAAYLRRAGWAVHPLLVGNPDDLKGTARRAYDEVAMSLTVVPFENNQATKDLLEEADVIVDALLGTGSKGGPRGAIAEAITLMNRARVPIVSVDIPSGLDPDSGEDHGAVRAFRTVTIGLPKVGMVSGAGVECCGTVRVAPILFPKDLLAEAPSPFETLTFSEAARLLPERPVRGHKGTFGLTLIVAGSETMPGAAALSVHGALRSGCGLVRLDTESAVLPIVASRYPEAIYTVRATMQKQLHKKSLERARAIVVGPGLGIDKEKRKLLRSILADTSLPLVIDADALTILAGEKNPAKRLTDRAILTPHPGELSRLLDVPVDEIEADRWGAAATAADRFGSVVLLKGNGTLVAHPNGAVTHIPAGNTSWARGGAGDVLAGLIGGLLAQGASPWDAARLGAFAHGMAADEYAREASPRAARVTEVADYLPKVFASLDRERQHLRIMESSE